ncbi:heterokaryon incompatibility protein-domain-containing protein [Astrocystis sublimbata]|nr:heterokaryon incompatibility protein-domain-containing protein [Astrocystis sublimbata]
MDTDELLSLTAQENHTISGAPDTHIIDLPEATPCDICAPIFAENSYERWSKYWDIWEIVRPIYRSILKPFPGTHVQPFPGRHHQSWQSLQRSMEQGCYICSYLVDHLGDPVRSPHPPDYPFRYNLQMRGPAVPKYTYMLSITTHVKDPQKDFLVFAKLQSPPNTLQHLIDQSRCRTWTGHSDIASMANGWITECLTNHEDCYKPCLNGFKPSRLLDISQDIVKLVPGSSEGTEKHHYATLSHCWGMAEFSRLTESNIPHYLAGVHISTFEPTFRETIATVRRLGLRYLWVDCYCIIQGHDAKAMMDWKKESKRMGDVYANSVLNIGALESNGPAGGLFREREPNSLVFKYKTTWSPTRQYGRQTFYLTAVSNGWHEYETKYSIIGDLQSMQKSPLMRRGWVVQECVLAPRMLSFGRNGVLWQCSSRVANEFEEGDPGKELYFPLPFTIFNNAASDRQHSHSLVKDYGHKWLSMLNYYGCARLKEPGKDIYAAIEGVAARFSKASGGIFKHGLFEFAMPNILLYGTRSDRSVQQEGKPSWHWATHHPKVDFGFQWIIVHRKSHEETRRKRLSAMFPLAYAFMSDDCKPLPTEHWSDFWPRILIIGRLMTKSAIHKWNPEDVTWNFDVDGDEDNTAKHTQIWYLPINFQTNPDLKRMDGLLRVGNATTGIFRRVGRWVKLYPYLKHFDDIVGTKPQLIILE